MFGGIWMRQRPTSNNGGWQPNTCIFLCREIFKEFDVCLSFVHLFCGCSAPVYIFCRTPVLKDRRKPFLQARLESVSVESLVFWQIRFTFFHGLKASLV